MDKRSAASGPGVRARGGRRRKFYLLAGLAALAVVLMLARSVFDLTPRSVSTEDEPARLAGILRAGEPEFENHRGRVVVAAPEAAPPRRVHGGSLVEVRTEVSNRTGRTLSGLELRGVLTGENGSRLAERTITVVPAQQTTLEPDETVGVTFLIEGVEREPELVSTLVEVTGLRFE